jgi:hypothetical protein
MVSPTWRGTTEPRAGTGSRSPSPTIDRPAFTEPTRRRPMLADAAALLDRPPSRPQAAARLHANHQADRLFDEFTELALDPVPFHIAILGSDGAISGENALALIRHRLAHREGQVLWTLNDNGELALGMKPPGGCPLKHAALANADHDLARLLEQPWEDAALDLTSRWLPERKPHMAGHSRQVASAGMLVCQQIEADRYRLTINNESGHFEPDPASLATLDRYHDLLKTRLSGENFQVRDLQTRPYFFGGAA